MTDGTRLSRTLTLTEYDSYEEGDQHVELQTYVPPGFEGYPTDVADVLRRVLAAIQDEERWMKGQWFMNRHPDVDPEDAFCNNWSACMDGHLKAVTIGAARRPTIAPGWDIWSEIEKYLPPGEDPQFDLYRDAARVLKDAASPVLMPQASQPVTYAIVTWNDDVCKTRTDAVRWLEAAINLAEETDR